MAQEVLYLSRRDVERVNLPMSEIIRAVEAVFLEKGRGSVEMPPKIGIHPTGVGFLHAMPALVPSARAAGIKWVGNFGENPAHKLQTISGLLILNDPSSGFPIAVMDCTWITAKRTAAASAVAAKYLARQDVRRLTIIGCGVQGRSHLEAMLTQFPDLSEIVACDKRPDALRRYVAEMETIHGVRVTASSDSRSAVRHADIVVSATEVLRDPSPVILPEWIGPGTFCMAIDFDAQFTPDAIGSMDLLYTDDLVQFEHYRTMGYFRTSPAVHGDLGEVVCGKKSGRTGPAQRTMAIFLGLAIEDVVVAKRIYELAESLGIGVRLPL